MRDLAIGVVEGAEIHVRLLDERLRVLGRLEHDQVVASKRKIGGFITRTIGGTLGRVFGNVT